MPVLFDGPGEKRWITVTEENGARYLHLDNCEEGAMALTSEEPVFQYLWFHKCSLLAAPPQRRILVLGAGAFTAAKCLALDHPLALVDAVDVEPALEALARQFFRLDHPEFQQIRFHGLPADEFLDTQSITYDFIFDDMFNGFQHVPVEGSGCAHVARLKSHLTAGGVCVKNVIWEPRSHDTRAACEETSAAFRAEFSSHAVLFLGNPERGHNRLLLGSPTPQKFAPQLTHERLLAAGVPKSILDKINR